MLRNNAIFMDCRKKITPVQFTLNFDHLQKQSVNQFTDISVIFDSSYTIELFINSKVLKSTFQLFRLRSIRK